MTSDSAVRIVGRYEIIREIGRGGMAAVHLARQTELDRYVALKELSAFHAADKSFAQRFVRESRMAGSLSHPNIVTVHDFFEWEGAPMIAMEYLSRGSLRPYVPVLTPAQATGVLEGLLAGLSHAEQHGIVHRDLKPENLMVSDEGRIKITDFGIAKASSGATSMLTATGTTVGTPTYMAPEQAMAREVGPWTDLYSVGCIAFEFYCGRVPFQATDTPMAILMQHVNDPPPPPRSVRPDLDPGLARWIESLLDKDPKARPQTAAEAWDELEELALSMLGPRWRREARLPESAADPHTPRPLTPAPFKSGLGPATPPPGEAAPAPDAESGFVTFGRPEPLDGNGAPQVGEPAMPSAGAAPVAEPPAPEGEGAPVAEPAAPEDRREPTEAPATGKPSGFVTFNPPPPPGPQPGDEEEEPPVATAPPPAEAPPAEPARAGTVTPAAAAPPPPAPPPEPPPPPVPAPDDTMAPAAPVAAKAAAPPAPSPEVASRRRWVAGITAGAVLAIVAGFLIGGSGGSSGETETASSGPTRALSSAQVDLRVPAGWQTPAGAPQNAGVTFDEPVAAAPRGAPAGAGLTAGMVDAEGPSLLPAELLELLGSSPEPDGAVRLGSAQAYAYRELLPGGANRMTLFTVPTAEGVATVACTWPGAAPASFTSACERAATTLRLKGVEALPLGPSDGFAKASSEVVETLDRRRGALRKRLAEARTRAGQASTAADLRRVYAEATTGMRGIDTGPAEAPATEAIVDAFAETRDAYGALASAARRSDRGDYRDAGAEITQAEQAAAKAVAGLKAAGYEPR